MKLLIINNPLPERKHLSDRRFAKMAAILLDAGVYAKLLRIQSLHDLASAISSEIPDIIYSAHYYVSGEQNERISVSAYLEDRNIPFIGSNNDVLELVLAKG